jgi:hypothetical protein
MQDAVLAGRQRVSRSQPPLSTQGSDPACSTPVPTDLSGLVCQSSDPLPLASGSGSGAPSALTHADSSPAATPSTAQGKEYPRHQYLSSWWSTGPVNPGDIQRAIQTMGGWSLTRESATVSICPWKCNLYIALPPVQSGPPAQPTASCGTSQSSGALTPTATSAEVSPFGRPNGLLGRTASASSGTSTPELRPSPSGCSTPKTLNGIPAAAGTPPVAAQQPNYLSAHSGIKVGTAPSLVGTYSHNAPDARLAGGDGCILGQVSCCSIIQLRVDTWKTKHDSLILLLCSAGSSWSSHLTPCGARPLCTRSQCPRRYRSSAGPATGWS